MRTGESTSRRENSHGGNDDGGTASLRDAAKALRTESCHAVVSEEHRVSPLSTFYLCHSNCHQNVCKNKVVSGENEEKIDENDVRLICSSLPCHASDLAHVEKVADVFARSNKAVVGRRAPPQVHVGWRRIRFVWLQVHLLHQFNRVSTLLRSV